jgi:hypothetical protein
MIEQHLRDWLLADTAIAAIVGTRIYPQAIPEASALPAMAYSMISDQALLSMYGPTSFRTPRFQMTMVAKAQHEVSTLSELVKVRINAWQADYTDMAVGPCFAEGGMYLSLDYYTPTQYGMIIDAYISWVP